MPEAQERAMSDNKTKGEEVIVRLNGKLYEMTSQKKKERAKKVVAYLTKENEIVECGHGESDPPYGIHALCEEPIGLVSQKDLNR